MDDHFDIGRVFEIGKFDITRLTCIIYESLPGNIKPYFLQKEQYHKILGLLKLFFPLTDKDKK